MNWNDSPFPSFLRYNMAWIALLLTCTLRAENPLPADDRLDYQKHIVPILKTHCFECHADGEKEGDLTFDPRLSDEQAVANKELWWKVLKNIRSHVMPPMESKRPSANEIATVAKWIKFRAFGIDPQDIDPGRMTVRRLNRAEYGNTVSDLMGIRFDATILFPPDDSGFGFDNVSDALSFSPLLMEKYLFAAQQIVERAVPRSTWMIPAQEFSGRDFQAPEGKQTGDSLSSKKPITVNRSVTIETAGKYQIDVGVKLHGSFEFDASRYHIVFRMDGQERSTNEYGWDEHKLLKYAFTEDWATGRHELSFELIPVPTEKEAEPNSSGDATFARFEVHSVRIEGPEGTPKRVHPPNYTRFFSQEEPPVDVATRLAYTEEILRKFAIRAFRSPVKQITLDRLVTIAQQSATEPSATFEYGIGQAMIAVLASPRFLFRTESAAESGTARPFSNVDEISLASRLSYFLWSTMPDEELFQLAESGQLRNNLPKQVARMMKDGKANEFIRNFVGQWLRARDVTSVSVDPLVVLGYQKEWEEVQEKFRTIRGRGLRGDLPPNEQKVRDRVRELRAIADQFDDELKRSMRRETEMCVEHIAQENLSLLDLLDCNYIFVNEKLAKHYGIPDVKGREMQRVDLPTDSVRGGVLSQASILLLTSNPTRTSPVKRGLFILDNILGTPSPPAPPNVPELEASNGKFADHEPTLRELLAVHRESALCSSCHARMDPLGLALENFNALGAWRTEEKETTIDASGTLITGESFTDIRELKKILREKHAEDFYRCVTQKLLTFAIGRGLEASDEQTVDVIVDRLQNSEGRFSELIDGVIASAPFQKIRTTSMKASL